MRYRVLHRGVPLGWTDLIGTELAIGELRPESGYDSIRQTILLASQSLWAAGFFADILAPAKLEPPSDALRRAAELELELYTPEGELIAADFVNIVERPTGRPPVVFVRFRLSQTAQPARVAPAERVDADANNDALAKTAQLSLSVGGPAGGASSARREIPSVSSAI